MAHVPPMTREQRALAQMTDAERAVLEKVGVITPPTVELTNTPPTSSTMTTAKVEFQALGKSGVSDIGGKIETFPAPIGLNYVELTSDEFTSLCPITGQPDFCVVSVRYEPANRCAESKSVKLYFQSFRERGAFCEQLAVDIADHFQQALRAKSLLVEVVQKSRGGITLTAQAHRGTDES